MPQRIVKQLIIAFILIAILFSIGYGFYFLLKPRPTCFDNKKNQNEEGIDCGGPCLKPCFNVSYPKLFIKTVKMIPVGQHGYDLVAEIENKNSNAGAQSFDYIFKIYDKNNQITEIKNKSYIMAGDFKYLIQRGIKYDGDFSKIELEIKNIKWVELENPLLPQFVVQNQKLEIINEANNYAKASAIVQNKSNFGFDTVEIETIIFDEYHSIIGVGSTNLYTVQSNDSRYFEVRWPTKFSSEPKDIIYKVQTNALLNENYLKIYGTKEKYQEF